MSDLPYQDDNIKWAENKRIARKCDIHNCYFDVFVGCIKCNTESSEMKSKESNDCSMYAMIKVGYKYIAGSYWKKIQRAEMDLYEGSIIRHDNEGFWVKVSRKDATDDISPVSDGNL